MITSHSLNLPSWPCAMVLLAPDLCILPTSPVSLYYYYLLVPDLGVPIIHNKKTFPLPYLNKPIYIFFSHFLLRALCLAHTPQSYLQIPAPLYHCYQVAIPSHSIYIQVFHHLLALPSQYPVIYITALNLKDILKHLPPSMSLSLSLFTQPSHLYFDPYSLWVCLAFFCNHLYPAVSQSFSFSCTSLRSGNRVFSL